MKPAILVIDIQNDYCSPKGKIALIAKRDVTPNFKLLKPLQKFLDEARSLRVQIIWTQMTETGEKIPANMKKKIDELGDIKLCKKGSWGYDLMLSPGKEDKVFEKFNYDALTDKKILKYLKKFDTLVITGVNTQACVNATISSAFSKGFNIIIPQELVSCPKEFKQTQNGLLKTWAVIYATVKPSKKILEELTKPKR